MSSLSISKGAIIPGLAIEKSLIDIFQETVQKYPNKEACIFENQIVSYTELDERSNAFSLNLQQSGIKTGKIIGVYLPRGIDLHLAILSVLKQEPLTFPLISRHQKTE